MSWRELSDAPCGFAVVHEIAQSLADGRCQFVEPFDPATDALSGFSQQTLDVQMALFSAGGRFAGARLCPDRPDPPYP